jgi:hypothetical protein
VERTPVEDAVHWADYRSTVGGDRGQRQEAHAAEPLDDLSGAEASIRRVDAEEMPTRARVAAVEKLLQSVDVASRLVHGPIESSRPGTQLLDRALDVSRRAGLGPALS